MKIISYTLFVSSASVKNLLIEKGVDPDTVYLNDYKFMKRVLNILVTIFGYRPSVTLDQFFKYGFSEQKMILCCDVINLVRRASKDIKLAKMLNRKRSSVSREAARGRYSVIPNKQDDGDVKSY
jgi:regulator of RNase E activity RraB